MITGDEMAYDRFYFFINPNGCPRKTEINEMFNNFHHYVINDISLLRIAEDDEAAWRRVSIYNVNDVTDLNLIKPGPHYNYQDRLRCNPVMCLLVDCYQTSTCPIHFNELYKEITEDICKCDKNVVKHALYRLFPNNNNFFYVTKKTVAPNYNVIADSYRQYLDKLVENHKLFSIRIDVSEKTSKTSDLESVQEFVFPKY